MKHWLAQLLIRWGTRLTTWGILLVEPPKPTPNENWGEVIELRRRRSETPCR